ncbi:hypothetical protein SLS58_007806 [Diplodia intermedia]|uniref:Uncharacterized protein n=1 Tax=Diplodia intermedia TaxID=856260 RepID=A0ABR3TJ92_9PEZI
MIGTSTAEYVFIRACILGLRSITPLCFLYCLARFLLDLTFPAHVIVDLWAVAEIAFYLLFYIPRKRQLQTAATHPPPPTREQRSRLFSRCSEHVPDFERYLRGWFMGAPSSEIKRENIREFLSWAFLDTADAHALGGDEFDGYMRDVEARLGRKVESGRGQARCLRLTLDKVRMTHRSLIWYLGKLPILFVHGIGIGLYPYVNFLSEINATSRRKGSGDVGIIAIEIMPISFRITSPALRKEEMCAEIGRILEAHGWDKFVLVSHSERYGSVISTHMLHSPKLTTKIGSILLIDPVTFLLHLPDVACNFIIRKPQHANEHQLAYFASQDMGVAHTLSRCFFWSENIMWKEDLAGRDVSVSLSGRDLIVDTETVRVYLAGEGKWKDKTRSANDLDVLWFNDLDHAQVFDKARDRKRLISVLEKYCARV